AVLRGVDRVESCAVRSSRDLAILCFTPRSPRPSESQHDITVLGARPNGSPGRCKRDRAADCRGMEIKCFETEAEFLRPSGRLQKAEGIASRARKGGCGQRPSEHRAGIEIEAVAAKIRDAIGLRRVAMNNQAAV